jgi:hypothetical protein
MSVPDTGQPVRIDPAFILGAERGLRVDPRCEVRDAYRYLTVRIARKPTELHLHLQRIHLLIDSAQSARLFGAIVDLFVALEEKGLALREAVLALAREQLEDEHYEYLRSHLAKGLRRSMTMPVTAGSVLDRGAMGSFSLVRRERGERVRREFDAEAAAADPFYVPPDIATPA